MDMENLSIA